MTDITCISPVDGSVYATWPAESAASVRARLRVARAAQTAWAATPPAERVALVKDCVAKLDAMNSGIVPELAWQIGRPVRYGGEMGGVHERTAYMAEIAATSLAPTEVETSDRFRRHIAREPLGLVYVIAPWNCPLLTAINTLVPALIAGNAVVLKHATQTAKIGDRLAEAFSLLPVGMFTNIHVTHEVSDDLIGNREFDFINFTGSVAGGQAVERAAAGTFVGIGLELGGKDPAYARADADLDAAVETLVDVTHDMDVMTEESFGPVVGIMKVSGDDEAIALMNDCVYGLTASIWTADFETAAAIGARLETGTVFMNRCDHLDPALCWTGCKATGRGTSLGFLSLTRPKSYHLRKM